MAKIRFVYRPPGEKPPPDPTSLRELLAGEDRWCYESSWDLLRGLQVSPNEFAETVPTHLLDQLFDEPPSPRGDK